MGKFGLFLFIILFSDFAFSQKACDLESAQAAYIDHIGVIEEEVRKAQNEIASVTCEPGLEQSWLFGLATQVTNDFVKWEDGWRSDYFWADTTCMIEVERTGEVRTEDFRVYIEDSTCLPSFSAWELRFNLPFE